MEADDTTTVSPLLLIGGSPSTGSSLLVYRLSKYPGVTCLPETGLFVHGDLVAGRAMTDMPDIDLGRQVPWLDFESKLTGAIDIDPTTIRETITGIRSSRALLRLVVQGPKNLIVEKTPENIFAFRTYLELAPENKVVVTLRKASEVVASLMRRGFQTGPALLIWFAHTYESARILQDFSGQAIACNYEDLAANPDKVARGILKVISPRTYRDLMPESCEFEKELQFSERMLANTAWSRSITEEAGHVATSEMIGLRLQNLLRTVGFMTAEHGIVRPLDLEESVLSGRSIVGIPETSQERVRPTQRGLLVDTLVRQFPMVQLEAKI